MPDAMPRKKPVEKTPPPEAHPPKVWWLGPLVVFICMLSATLLAGLLTPAFGRAAVLVEIGENAQPEERIEFKALNSVGPLQLEKDNENNDVIVITFRFANLTEDNVRESYVFGIYGQAENITIFVDLMPNEVLTENITIVVENREMADYEFALVDSENENRVLGSGIFRWGPPREISDIVSHTITFSVALVVVYLHVTRFEGVKFWPSVGVRRENLLRSLVWVFSLSVVFSIILSIYWAGVQSVMGGDPQEAIQRFFRGAPDWYFIYLSVAFFFPVAFTEELVFRGFMIERFLVKGAAKAIALSALLFTSLHLWYAGFGAVSVPLYGGLFMVSVWWGIVYYKTRNIFGLVIFHGLFNLGMTVEHFWGIGGRAALESAVFVVGVVCILYVVFLYLKGLFAEMEELVKKR
jgi:membrane protease YdiL (CAAX protease family)